jgi:3-oxoacyl-[acyl-carrier protein] reductase
MKLQVKTALVTGGGTGMGRAICELFATEGARVAVNHHASIEAAEDVVRAIVASGGDAFAIQTDVANEGDVKRMITEVDSRWGRLDVLVNNAGWTKFAPHKDLEALTDDIWDRTLDTNLRGAFYCTRQAVPLMKRGGGGAIVNNTSAAAFHASGSSIIYAASKAAAVTMTKSLARALAPEIRVNGLAPGLIATSFTGFTNETFQKEAKSSPMGCLAGVEEIAKAALFLAVDATATTGEIIMVDCGRTALGPRGAAR